MASTFKFHSDINTTVPWQSQYMMPTQSTRINKSCVKLPPKNGGTFREGDVIRIEFPSDQYLNVLNSVLILDVTPTVSGTTYWQRGGAQNLIKRLKISYGSLVIEDIPEYKTLVRIFTEAGVQQDYMASTGTILDGMYEGMFTSLDPVAGGANAYALGTGQSTVGDVTTEVARTGVTAALSLAGVARTYCLNLLSGVLTCKKLIPLKWMAAQLVLEITLAPAVEAYLADTGSSAPSYSVTNVNFLAEMLEFDSTYDTAFYQGMSSGGVPLKFSSFHFHSFTCQQTNIFQIHERSRSVKAAFAVCRDATYNLFNDSDRFYYDLANVGNSTTGAVTGTGATITDFQWRVGGRYYPSQPVRCTLGAPEAYVELLKALDSLGDYTRASNIKYDNWTTLSGGSGSKFIIACEFENADVSGNQISGINSEEQSDIALILNLAGVPQGKICNIFVHYDIILTVMPNNNVSLVM